MKTKYDGIGIYALIDNDGKMYIGSSVNVKQRIIRHRYSMKKGTCNSKILKALNEGKKFHCEILEKIEYGCTLWHLYERERFYIEKYDSFFNGYNMVCEVRSEESYQKKRLERI